MDTASIIKLIKESVKRTRTRAFVSGDLDSVDWSAAGEFSVVRCSGFGTISGESAALAKFIESNARFIRDWEMEPPRARNSAVPLADLTKYDARVEPGAVIRGMADIGKNAVVMMGAVINIGASIGTGAMIDMNAVIGGRAVVGARCHVGAGAVVAGVIEPISASPTVIEDDAFVGANAVILEGVRVGRRAVVAAGAVVTRDVPPGAVVAGSPAEMIKMADAGTESKTAIVEDLRNI
ncbi:MAG: 2,3,4,5-tetrahydropyridine-2,6-dicarboxylate N-acetyltransferase [Synergistaceae bacterium]|jgi:2,3,4,5-tetrahydropyridine-2,6-dicarboxylate N-acetyltransferase|nr:2,3,4,5-tetrahydropyridine-2,6-dicarboxylate N-acetyltransferase [Synergistaceae bacterium]